MPNSNQTKTHTFEDETYLVKGSKLLELAESIITVSIKIVEVQAKLDEIFSMTE